MRAFRDYATPADKSERRSARMECRTYPAVKDIVEKAAAMLGVDASQFVMSSAAKEALATIEANEHTFLQPVDHAAFFEAMDRPAAPTDKLRAAFKRHSKQVKSI